jgi:hypothetical protein
MTEQTCQERVSNGPRSVSFHTCGKPVKDEGLCGVHLAAKRRKEANSEARRSYYDEQARLRQASERRVDALAEHGIYASVEYCFDFARQQGAYTGGVVLRGDDADALVATLALIATT